MAAGKGHAAAGRRGPHRREKDVRASFLVTPTLVALAACSSQPAQDETAREAQVAPAAPGDAAAVARAADAAAGGIPEALQGRWGLDPADCEPGRSDADGLLVIDADSLEFYESMGELGAIEARTAGRIRADFAFTGEGMEWTREMELATPDGGETMVRREFGEEAMAGPLEYARCT